MRRARRLRTGGTRGTRGTAGRFLRRGHASRVLSARRVLHSVRNGKQRASGSSNRFSNMNFVFTRKLWFSMAFVCAGLGVNGVLAYLQLNTSSSAGQCTEQVAGATRRLAEYMSVVDASLDALRASPRGVFPALPDEPQRAERRRVLSGALRAADPAGIRGDTAALAAQLASRAGAWQDMLENVLASRLTDASIDDLENSRTALAASAGRWRDAEYAGLEHRLAASADMARWTGGALSASALACLLMLLKAIWGRERAQFGRRAARMVADENAARFLGVFNAHPMPMWIFDPRTLRFLAANGTATQHYGYSQEDFLAMTVRDLRPQGESGRAEWYLLDEAAGSDANATIAGVFRHRCKDGTIVHADITYHWMTFDGRPAVFVLADDVTEQMHAEAAAHRGNLMLESVLDSMPQRVFWKDRESRYLGCNKAFAEDAGLACPEEIIGRTDADLPWAGRLDTMTSVDREVLATGIARSACEMEIGIDGAMHSVVASVLPLTEVGGGVIGVLGSYPDVTRIGCAHPAPCLQPRAPDAGMNAVATPVVEETGLAPGCSGLEPNASAIMSRGALAGLRAA
jgi:PAS domain S-box-containing protein